jgi:RNA polymerase sigma-70 factor (ECF subfamily)
LSHVIDGPRGVIALLAALRPAARPAPDGGSGARELLARVQAGEPGAFGEFYDRYGDLVGRYVLARLGDRAAAEDITSEVFIRALRYVGTFQWRGVDPGAWLVTIARNLVLDHAGSARYRMEVTTAEPRASAVADPEAAALSRLAHAEVLRCVRLLSADQQEVIALRYLSDLSIAATAELMGRTPGAVKALQHRALRRLAALLPADL